jgi:drug/metabolite transporter (DMT)-like permease
VREPSRLSLGLAFTAICVIWGSTYLAIKVGLETFDPFFYVGLRYLLAAPLMAAYCAWRRIGFPGPVRRWLPVFGVGVLLIGVCNGAVFWAETRLDSGYTALLISVSPLSTALLSPLLPGERGLGRGGWIGIVVGFAGTVWLVAPWHSGRFELVAAAAVVLSTLVWAAGSLWVRRLRHHFDPLAMTTAQMAAGAVVLLALSAVRGRALVGPVTPRSLAGLAFLVVFGSCVAFGSYFFLLRHWPATRVSTCSYVNPVVALALGALILGEAVTARMLAATVVILVGVALVLREQHSG